MKGLAGSIKLLTNTYFGETTLKWIREGTSFPSFIVPSPAKKGAALFSDTPIDFGAYLRAIIRCLVYQKLSSCRENMENR